MQEKSEANLTVVKEENVSSKVVLPSEIIRISDQTKLVTTSIIKRVAVVVDDINKKEQEHRLEIRQLLLDAVTINPIERFKKAG